jgi:hypothetical protein
VVPPPPPAVQVTGIALGRESPQMPSDTAIDSSALPAVVQVNTAVAAFVGASVPTPAALFVHV